VTIVRAPHGMAELCATGAELRSRWTTEADARSVLCLVGLGLLYPADAGPRPVAPAVALRHTLRRSERRIGEERRREERPARTGEERADVTSSPVLRLLTGSECVDQAITEATTGVAAEVLSSRPGTPHRGGRRGAAERVALERDQALLDRGGRIRAFCQHTQRHHPMVIDRTAVLDHPAATLGSDSRTRLGHLVGESGIPNQKGSEG